jgi:cyclophilin family peptidyl-prolyl cis-trans isomerase
MAADLENTLLLTLESGVVTIDLRPDLAPGHVARIKELAREGFYDGVVFHRVIPGFMAQGGDPTGSGSGGPGYKFGGEFDGKRKHDKPGILSMAHAGPGTDGSQFFITFGPTAHLDNKHTIWGEVVEGMEAVKALEKLGSQQGQVVNPPLIKKATVSAVKKS